MCKQQQNYMLLKKSHVTCLLSIQLLMTEYGENVAGAHCLCMCRVGICIYTLYRLIYKYGEKLSCMDSMRSCKVSQSWACLWTLWRRIANDAHAANPRQVPSEGRHRQLPEITALQFAAIWSSDKDSSALNHTAEQQQQKKPKHCVCVCIRGCVGID